MVIIGIMTSNPSSDDVTRYRDEIAQSGCELIVLNYNDSDSIERSAPNIDACIVRGRPADTVAVASAIAILESHDVTVSASSKGWMATRDRMIMADAFKRGDIPHPNTWRQDLASILNSQIPFIVKQNDSNQGRGVRLIQNSQDLKTAQEEMHGEHNYILQEFIQNTEVYDDRYFVVGNEVVAAMRRHAKTGEFRSNLAQGGNAVGIELDPVKVDIALQSAEVVGCLVAGVDIMDSEDGPRVIEVNPSPGLGIEKVTSTNVASKVIEFLKGHKHD